MSTRISPLMHIALTTSSLQKGKMKRINIRVTGAYYVDFVLDTTDCACFNNLDKMCLSSLITGKYWLFMYCNSSFDSFLENTGPHATCTLLESNVFVGRNAQSCRRSTTVTMVKGSGDNYACLYSIFPVPLGQTGACACVINGF